jgi:hypothetical protein
MENLNELVKEARGLLDEMGKVLVTLNTGISSESDTNTLALERDIPANDPEASER